MSSAADVLVTSVLRGVRGVGGVCKMCMCLARGGVGRERSEWMRRLGLGFTNHVGIWLYQSCRNKWSVGRVSVFGLRWCV